MRKLFILFGVAILGLLSCKKSTVSPGNNPGGGNAGGGNSGSLAITSISPNNPYPDEEITITGTGFNADKTRDTIEFGDVSSGGFKAWHDGLESEWPSLATVVHATATQLVVKAVNPKTMDFYAFNKPGWPPQNPSPPSVAGIQVRAGGGKAQTEAISFKRYMALSSVHDEDGSDLNGRPNDSLVISGQGFDTTGVTFSIGTKPIVPALVTHNFNNYTVALRLPKEYFGNDNDEKKQQAITVSVKNPDGREEKLDCAFYISPKMHVNSMAPLLSSYKLSAGGTIYVDIKGSCLKNDVTSTYKVPMATPINFRLT